jgi:hypothetical protein
VALYVDTAYVSMPVTPAMDMSALDAAELTMAAGAVQSLDKLLREMEPASLAHALLGVGQGQGNSEERWRVNSVLSRSSSQFIKSYVLDDKGHKQYVRPDRFKQATSAAKTTPSKYREDNESQGSDWDSKQSQVHKLADNQALNFDLLTNTEEFLFSIFEVSDYSEDVLQRLHNTVHTQASQVIAVMGRNWLIQLVEYATIYWQFLEQAIAAAKLSHKQYAHSDLYPRTT